MKLQVLKNKLNKKYAVRIIAGVLSIAVIGTGSAFYGVSTAKASNEKDKSVQTVTNAADDGVVSTLLSGVTVSKKEIGKEETVYLITDATGKVTKTIVSDRLSNADEKATITDKSNLSDIVNVKGDEDYTNSNGTLTWNANGKEICYQGTTTEAVPVTQKVTYYLDGKEIAPEELAGQSGKVTIRFDYENNSSYTATVEGKKVDVKVPFAAVSALVLTDDFKNVEVTNGAVKTADGKSVVIGYALPGMTESLGLEDGQIPEYFEVTADVENFELKTAMTLVVNAANYASSEGLDLSTIDTAVNTLADAAGQLQSGSGELADGLDTLKGSLVEFVNGMQTLNNSKDTLASGVTQLNGSAASLNAATQKLQAALKAQLSDAEIAQYKALAKAGVDLTFEKGVKADTINKVYASLRYNADGTDNLVYTTLYNGALKSTVDTTYTAKVKEVLVGAVVSAGAMTTEQASALTADQLAGAIKTTMTQYANYSTTQLAETLYVSKDTATTQTGLTLYGAVEYGVKTQGADALKAGVETSIRQIATGIVEKAVIPGAESAAGTALIQGIEQTKANILSQITTVQDNGYSFVTGMEALSNGTQTLADAVPALTAGITKLTDASLLIQDGVNKLDDGSHQLADGILQFNEEGINKLVNAYDGDVKALANKIQAVLDAGESYQIFTDVANDTNGSVKFIYKLGSVTVK